MVEFSNLGLLENQSIIKVNVSAIQTITDNLPNSGALTDIAQVANQSTIIANQSTILDTVGNDATLANQTTILQYNQTIDSVVDGIKTVTDLLPNNGALSSLGTILNQSLVLVDGDNILANTTSLIISNSTIDTVVDGIKTVTDALPDSGALTSLGTMANQSLVLTDGDLIITNTSSLLDNLSSGEIGDASLANQSTILQFNQTIDGVADSIKSVTDLLPDSGALSSLGTLANQSLVLVDGDNILANTTSLIISNSTIDTVVDSIKVITDALPDSGGLTSIGSVANQSLILIDGGNLISNTSSLIGSNSTIDVVVDAIKTVTDALPNSGSLTSIAQVANQSILIQNNATIDAVVDSIKTVTDLLPDSGALSSLGTLSNQTLILTDGDNVISNTSSLIGSNSTIDTVVDGIKTITDALPDSGALTSLGSIANQTLIMIDVDTILTNTSSLLSNSTEVSGYYNLSTASGPHTVFTISIIERKRLDSIFLDLVNLSYMNNIKIDHKIDGTNYRTIYNTSWAITDDDSMVYDKTLAFTHDVRLTMTNGTTANATVPYYYILESIE